LLDAHFCITFLLKFAHCIALKDAQMHSFAFLFTTKFMNILHGFWYQHYMYISRIQIYVFIKWNVILYWYQY